MTNQVEKVRNFLRELAKEKGYNNATIEVYTLSSENCGYTSAPCAASISAPPKENLNLFAKVANFSEELRASNEICSVAFSIERFFYTDIAVTFEDLYNKHNVQPKDRLYIPTYYGFKSTAMEEMLVLENLETKGYMIFNRLKSFEWDYASRAVEEMAKFHALGLVYRIQNPGKLREINKNLQINWLANENVKGIFLDQAIKMGTQRVKEEYRSKMRKYFEENNLIDDIEKLWTCYGDGFLIHGEYRPNNLMHRNHNGKLEIVPIDYQTYRLGALAIDLMYFIWFGSDEHFRRDHFGELVGFYYKQLAQALLNFSIDINNVYPRATFEKELERVKYLGLFIGLTNIPILTVHSKPKFDNFENLVMIEPSEIGLERMNGIVGDYIKWGLI